jgi:Cd2+/Zn2+-exporting ATPase
MNKKQKKVLVRIVITLVLMIVLHFIHIDLPYVTLVLYLIPYLIIGYDILSKALHGIRSREIFDENFLMAVATVGAILLGEYAEGVAVMLFYQIGELFQSYAVGKSRKNISDLMDIRPDYANIEVNGQLEQIDPDEVAIGSVVVVLPGERIPIDGIVADGESALNTSALTGESVPREVTIGDEVISGCVNISGRLRIRTTKEFGDSTVSRILDLVENSSMKKSRSENFITRFAKYYTPAVCYSALALAVIPPLILLLLGMDPAVTKWITRGLTFLVISCPCALVISIPLSFFGGIGGASARGILVKGSNYLELLSNTRYIAFDKTGTLTRGVFEVTQINTANDFSSEELVQYAAYAESYSTHPISKSIQSAYGKDIDNTVIENMEEISGHGVSAVVMKHHILAGNARLMDKYQIAFTASKDAGTIVYVAVDEKFAGSIVISDQIKEHSADAIASLKAAGIQTVMLTGDSRKTAEDIGSRLGVDVIKSELLPTDKVNEVEALLSAKKSGECVAFVGDGINDAPVLSRADIGIAMGAMGSDAAIEAADIVLMDDDPAKIALAMKISRKTLRIVRQNIVLALVVKFACLILAAVGIANMWLAIFADVGVMVIAVLNATRALNTKTL